MSLVDCEMWEGQTSYDYHSYIICYVRNQHWSLKYCRRSIRSTPALIRRKVLVSDLNRLVCKWLPILSTYHNITKKMTLWWMRQLTEYFAWQTLTNLTTRSTPVSTVLVSIPVVCVTSPGTASIISITYITILTVARVCTVISTTKLALSCNKIKRQKNEKWFQYMETIEHNKTANCVKILSAA